MAKTQTGWLVATGALLAMVACGAEDARSHELDASGRLTFQRLRALQLDAEVATGVVSEVSGLAWRHPVTAVSLDREGIRGHLEQREQQHLRVPVAAELAADQAEEVDFLAHRLLGFFAPEQPQFLYVANDVSSEERSVVLRHEMMHALQHQHFDTPALQTAAGALGGDAGLALGAVFEGQATAVQFGHLSPTVFRPQNPLPRGDGTLGHVGGHAYARKVGAVRPPAQVARKLAHEDAHATLQASRRLDLAGASAAAFNLFGLPFASAMRSFPYLVGQHFVGSLAAETSLAQAIRDTLSRPPRSTREVLHPEVYRRGEVPPTLTLTALEAAWRPKFAFRSTVGEYVTALMLGGDARAFDLAEGWRADAVLADAATENGYWVSLWADDAGATAFLARLQALDAVGPPDADPDVQRLGDAAPEGAGGAPHLSYLRCGRAVVVGRGVGVAPDALAAAAAQDLAALRPGEK